MDFKGQFRHTYLVYARKSTDDPDNQKNSIAYQRVEGIKYARQQGLPVPDIETPGFCKAGIISERHTGFKEGGSFTIGKHGVQYAIERPKFHQLVQLLWQREFKGVIFLCWDRASRNDSDNTVLNRLMEQGIDVRFVQVTYDNTSAGWLHKDTDATFAKHYSRSISEKVRNTTQKLRADGICTYRAPVGYLNQGDPRHKPFDPVRAPIVKQLFEKYAEGRWSLSDLARWASTQGLTMPPVRRRRTEEEMLDEEEVTIDRVARPVRVTNLHTILRNPFYVGYLRSSKGELVASTSHAPLIDQATFAKVQFELTKRKVSTRYTEKIHYPYRGLIRCGNCKRVYTPYEQKGHCYYGARCGAGCPNTTKSINQQFIENKVGDVIKHIHFTDEELREISKAVEQEVASKKAVLEKEKESYGRQLKKLQEDLEYLRQNKLVLLKAGAYTPEDIQVEERSLSRKVDEITAKMNALNEPYDQMFEAVKNLSELLKTLYFYYGFANAAEKQEIIHIVFSELTISEKTLEYQCKNGFKVLKSPDFFVGEPTTWLSEAALLRSEIEQSIEAARNFLSNKREAPP